ncbi:MAG TPA: serine hydrolase domain-containing protein [Longimicrobiales bacterium]|nr:serine hydrolase domain-containing protein [Longimicrobiales bacterium]
MGRAAARPLRSGPTVERGGGGGAGSSRRFRAPRVGSVAALIAALVATGCAPADDAPEAGSDAPEPTPEVVAAGLRPAIRLEGEPPTVFSLDERMAHYHVPGVSVAVLDDGEIAWAEGWGVADGETGAPVTPGTLFQAASISKPVAALTAMTLVEDGLVGLDDPVNDHLTSWRVPDNEFTADSVVTLRGLLSHTAGLTVWGFPGYRKDEPFANGRPVATNVEVLDGLGNTDSVRVYKEPGVSWQYSGGGYTVVEQLVEDLTGRPFHEVARERVLEPAGMVRSTYEQPLPEDRWDEASRGHLGDGAEVEGEWHNYPEQAAAGLWTTPTDLLVLSAHLLDILHGEVTDGVVTRETLETMLTGHRTGEEGFRAYGLGFGVEGEGDAATFGHGGSNAGFKSNWVVYRHRGDGAAVMTNGDRGSTLAGEILRSVSAAWDWPGFEPEVRSRRRITEEEARQYAGEYVLEGEDLVLTVRPGEGGLLLDVPEQGTFTLGLQPDTPDTFFDFSDGQTLEFQRGDDGSVDAVLVQGQATFVRRPSGGG